MKAKQNYYFYWFSVVLAVFVLFSCGKKGSSPSSALYFVEDYKDGKEIGRSEKFTTGYLTAMIDLRSDKKTLGTGKVELKISQIKDANGKDISEKIIKTVPFDVQADWDYTFFTDHDNLKFDEPGTYKVVCQKPDGTPITSGIVEIIPGKNSNSSLYFVEQYVNGEEIGRSTKFTPGWLTVMIDLRGENKTLGTGKVELRLSKIKDAAGNEISEKIIKTIPFDVQADWGYTFFTDKSNLKFTEPGTYKVVCQKTDGTPLATGTVEIIPK
jgi:hypothetical protein